MLHFQIIIAFFETQSLQIPWRIVLSEKTLAQITDFLYLWNPSVEIKRENPSLFCPQP